MIITRAILGVDYTIVFPTFLGTKQKLFQIVVLVIINIIEISYKQQNELKKETLPPINIIQ